MMDNKARQQESKRMNIVSEERNETNENQSTVRESLKGRNERRCARIEFETSRNETTTQSAKK
jgi:hypothetical protein